MPTMADVAKRAGVSLSTVSHAMSGKRTISTETKERIFRVMAELDYQPHVLARGLATRRSKIIALLLPFVVKGLLEAQFEFVTSAAETASKLGYSLVLWTSPSEHMEVMRMTQQGFIDGLILMEITLNDIRVQLLKERHYPFSMIGRCENNDQISYVDVDFDYVARICVDHLTSLGHRCIAMIAYTPALFEAGYGPAVRSFRAFQQILQECGLTGFFRLSDPTPESGYEITRALLTEGPALSAIICLTDTVISGVTQAIQDAGLRVPNDISVMALTGPTSAGLVGPLLTGMDFPATEMGRIGTEMLIQRLEGQAQNQQQLLLCPELKIRQSTGPCSRGI